MTSCGLSMLLFFLSKSTLTDLVQLMDDTIIGVKYGQVIHRGLKVRLHEVRSSDRGFRVDQEVVSKVAIYEC